MTRTDLLNGCYFTYSAGTVIYRNVKGELHRLDGPAIIYSNGSFQYFVNGEVPRNILNIVITDQMFDFEAFPSAFLLRKYSPFNYEKAYHISDPDELVLAILRYS